MSKKHQKHANRSENPPVIILVEPQMGENIGAAARAMLNFGLTELRIVNPRDGWPNTAADANASGAFEHMPPPQIFPSLRDAIADFHYVLATTARPRGMVKPSFTPAQAIEEIIPRTEEGQRCAIVFGPERTGLENEDVALCQSIIQVPTNPDFSSLNLGQCVLLVAYELFADQARGKVENIASSQKSEPAPQLELNNFIARLDEELDRAGFYREENLKPTMQRNIRNMFTRPEFTEQELRTLHGMVSALTGKKKEL